MVDAPMNRAGEAVGGQLQREVESGAVDSRRGWTCASR